MTQVARFHLSRAESHWGLGSSMVTILEIPGIMAILTRVSSGFIGLWSQRTAVIEVLTDNYRRRHLDQSHADK